MFERCRRQSRRQRCYVEEMECISQGDGERVEDSLRVSNSSLTTRNRKETFQIQASSLAITAGVLRTTSQYPDVQWDLTHPI